MVTLGHLAIDKIPIEECNEKMDSLDPNEFVLDPQYYKMGFSDTEVMKLRRAVIEKLREAKRKLNSISGYENWNIKIWDGFRTVETQRILYFNYWNFLLNRHRDWDDTQIRAKVETFVAPPSADPLQPAPHNTGGTVDLTLVDGDGNEIPMGTAFDEFNKRSFTDHFVSGRDDISGMEDSTAPDILLEPARVMEYSVVDCQKFHRNRMFLKELMESVGFTNYPDEWWDYSFGNQKWAAMKGKTKAFYGSMEI